MGGPRDLGKLGRVLEVKRLLRSNGKHCDGGGLWLFVSPSKSKAEKAEKAEDADNSASWAFRYQMNGTAREMGLGSFRDVSLKEARDRGASLRSLKASGVDPIQARDAAKAKARLDAAKTITFKECAESYIKAQSPNWKNAKHAAQWTATLEAYVYGTIGSLPVGDVDVSLVHKILEPIWSAKAETASRVRGRIEAILNWAKARGFRDGENPARWRGHLENLFPRRNKAKAVKHHASLPYGQIGAFMGDLRKQSGEASRALQFAILTAGRTSEVLNATAGEIDTKAGLWVIPAERMKAGKEHRVPLSPQALAVLAESERRGGYLFGKPGAKKPLSNMAMLKLLERMERDDLTAHGFRSTFRTWAAERTNFHPDVCESALSHTIGDAVVAAYSRGDFFEKRTKLMVAWGRYCATMAPQEGVVPIRAAHG